MGWTGASEIGHLAAYEGGSMERGVTHELAIGLGAGVEGLGEAVAAWLEARGLSYAESLMGDEALLVYDTDRRVLEMLAADVEVAFPGAVALRHTALRDDAWQGVWDPAGPTGAVTIGSRTLKIGEGTAFGQGDHASTEACLRALESWAGARGPMLDVGTGTGVLAIAAHVLGYGPIVGTDLDDSIVAEARANADRNGVDASTTQFYCTSEIPVGSYALVTANIPAPSLHLLMPALVNVVAPGGALILAGFVEKEADALVAAARGMQEWARTDVRGWTGLILSSPAR